jgi:LytTr DNA-binding domain
LKGMLEILPLSQFVQIHRSYIVNFKRVTEIEGNIVKLDTIALNIGKNFRDDFIARVRSNSI